MRILFLCHRVPYPLNKGEKIRAFHQLRAIAARHEVDLFTLADDEADLAHESVLLRHCRRVTIARLIPQVARLRSLPYLATHTPLTVPYFHSADLKRKVRQALASRSYDRIFVYCSAMAKYAEGADGIPVLLDLVDVDSNKWTQYAEFARFPWSAVYRREARTLQEYERQVCSKSSCILVTTAREADLLRQIDRGSRIEVLPNGVDTHYFRPVAPDADANVSAAPVLVFVGDMSYFPNESAAVFFAQTVLPAVQKRIPEARFMIVGRNPGRNVRQLERLAGVEVTGSVPDVRPYLARARVSVAPFAISAGVPNKILEAMACGLPVVATDRAVQGLTPGVAQVVERAGDAGDMADRTVDLLRDPGRARLLGMQGRRRVAEDYDWNRAMDRLLRLLEDPVQEARAGRQPSLA